MIAGGAVAVALTPGASPVLTAAPVEHPFGKPPQVTRTASASRFRVRNFVWVGVYPSNPGQARQFNATEFRRIADKHDFVVIARFHCGGDRLCQAAAARRLKEMRPGITVLTYLNVFIRGMDENLGRHTFRKVWYLKHRETLKPIHTADGNKIFLDVSARRTATG